MAMTFGGRAGEDGPGDEALVTAAQRGDAKAFAALHKRYYARIYRLAYLKTNNVADAEDVAGETFLRALSHLPQFRFASLASGSRTAYPWLHRITLNLIADSGRRRAPSGTVSLDAETAGGLRALLSDSGPTPHDIAERREVQQLVRDAIATMPPDQADVLTYRFLGELSLTEIARLTGRTESAAKSLLHRAVVGLRAELTRRLDYLGAAALTNQYQGKEASSGGSTVLAGRRRED